MLRLKFGSQVLFFSLLLLLTGKYSLFSQEKTAISPNLELQYFKNTSDSSSLVATLSYSSNRMLIPLPDREISFYSEATTKKLIGTVKTDQEGNAVIDLTKYKPFPSNNEGFWIFGSQFGGNDTIEQVAAQLSVKDVNLEMSLTETDSIRTITLKAFTTENKIATPVSGEIVVVYVPRMFSLLPIGEATLDNNGMTSLEFPRDLPGDNEGNLTIISRFEQHPTFGNVERKAVVKWGIIPQNSVPLAHRSLWTKTPPMWMIVTLSILLTGVWGHYLFAVISLILIKKADKSPKLKTRKIRKKRKIDDIIL